MEMIKIENGIELNKDRYVERFLEYIDVSENTVREYRAGLKKFFDYCIVNEINNIKRENIIEFRELLRKEGKEANTVNLYLSSVKSFFKWLEYENVCKDITKNVKSLPVETTHRRNSFTIEEVKIILKNCKTLRERVIIMLAINCGLRCNEICNIRITDFQIKENKVCLYVLGKARKGEKVDFIIIDALTFQTIKKYIEEEKINDYLFTSTSNNSLGKNLSTRSMRNIFNNILERCGLKTRLNTFHSMRHTNASLAIQNGIDIREVSQNLRHKSINTTMMYLHDLEMKNNKCSSVVSNLFTV